MISRLILALLYSLEDPRKKYTFHSLYFPEELILGQEDCKSGGEKLVSLSREREFHSNRKENFPIDQFTFCLLEI